MASEKFQLQWNEFQNNLRQSLKELRDSEDFCDVTLACDDESQINVHKVILAAASPFFQKILKRNTQQKPFIYLRGVKFSDLEAVVNFMYQGEVSIYEENLNDFLAVAEDFQLKGLSGREKITETENSTTEKPTKFTSFDSKPTPKQETNSFDIENTDSIPTDNQTVFVNDTEEKFAIALPAECENKLSVSLTEMSELDDTISSMVVQEGGLWSCTVCGKQSKRKFNLRAHVEVHIDSAGHPCNKCDKTFRSRNSLNFHTYTAHKRNKVE